MKVHSFAPIADASARVLILGSMPGRASLRANQYYAHPQNSFWKILDEIMGIDAAAPDAERTGKLRGQGVALWDVLKSCTRTSSLDSDIVEASIVVNEFGDFFRDHPQIRAICFNGAKAETSYRRRVLPELSGLGPVHLCRLPSTSPANASIRYARKLEAWQVLRSLAADSLARTRRVRGLA